ncbi:MAG: MFS transporter [Dehalococcoidia bacterium]|nr:MFS transporter [Dehalococcoidia bacterium]MCB9484622.1 MFS transporter [Thermoflexaceae bacterium]
MTVERKHHSVLSSFYEPDFRKVWAGSLLFGLGTWVERLATGWFVLEETDSVFLAAVSFAIRTVPNLVLGPIGGAVSDRLPRSRVLLAASLVRMVASALMALVVFIDIHPVPILLALVFVTGATIAFQNTALQPLQAEIVGPDRLGNAISLTSLGQRAVGVLGALGGGALLAWNGAAITFLLAAVPLAGASLVFARLQSSRPVSPSPTSLAADVVEGLNVIVRTPMVRLLLGMMILVEILGFSFNGLLPAVAERVLEVGPERLGVLTAGVSVGAVAGTVFLVFAAERFSRGLMLIAVFATFGVLLVLLGSSTLFWVSVALAAGIGASAAMVDALEWILLQQSVPDHLRGRVLGGWNFAIGWGWIGPIVLGAIADAFGVPTALALSGSALFAVALVAAVAAPALRRR